MRKTLAEVKPELRNPGVPAGWTKPEYTVAFNAPGCNVPEPMKFDNKFEASEEARKWVLSFVAINPGDRFSKGMDNGFACYLRKPYRRLAFATFKQTNKAQPGNIAKAIKRLKDLHDSRWLNHRTWPSGLHTDDCPGCGVSHEINEIIELLEKL